MNKTMFTLMLLAAAAALPADNGMKKFELSEETAAVKAGTVLNLEVAFECDEGFVLAGWSVPVIRKNAPPEFFAKPGLTIRPHKTAKDYDAVDIVKYNHFPQAEKSGKFPVRINTTGMAAGDYALGIQGRFMKGNQSFYPGKHFFLTITEGDDKPFAPTAQPVERKAAPVPNWCKNIVVTPNPVKVKAGEKVSFQCAYTALPGESFGGHIIVVIRKNAPQGFFDLPGLTIRKHAKAPDYDMAVLLPFVPHEFVPEVTIPFELDTTGYPAGDYTIGFQVREVKADGKLAYPTYPVALTVE